MIDDATPLMHASNAMTAGASITDAAAAWNVTISELAAYNSNREWVEDVQRASMSETDPAVAHTWTPVDLTSVLNGSYQPPQPTVGARDDGIGLFYPGRVHTVASESEAGKTWLALCAALHVIDEAHQQGSKGRGVLYIDFEDDEGGVVSRLLALGAVAADVREWFGYLRPAGSIQNAINRDDLQTAIHEYRPALIVLDGVTEAMSLHGLELKDNTDVAKFNNLLPRALAATGAAVVLLDHVVKDREGRGRYSLGGVHKLNAVDGAAYTLENRTPFGEGITGRSTVLIAKDRPAQLRKHAVRTSGGLHWFADLVLDSEYLEGIPDLTGYLKPPEERPEGPFRPTTLMRRVSEALERAGEPLTVRGILDRVRGRGQDVRAAVAVLLDDGYLAVEKGERGAQLHRLVTPFGDTGEASTCDS